MPGGRKPWDWEEHIDEIEKYAALGLTEEQIYLNLGISHETFYKVKRENSEFAEAIKRGKSSGITQVTNSLFKNATEGNLGAQVFYLKNRDKNNWKDKIEEDVQEQQNVGIQDQRILELSKTTEGIRLLSEMQKLLKKSDEDENNS